MRRLRTIGLLVVAVLATTGFAEATPLCRDTPVPDPTLRFESLPTHAEITAHLADVRNSPRYTCTSAALEYSGRRDAEGIRVVSRYRRGGAVHATTYSRRRTPSGDWRKHGIVEIRSRGGALQAREYYCEGFEVGFHSYFDAQGRVSAVVDFTRSDYEVRKPLDSSRYRAFYDGTSMLGTVSAKLEGGHRFREAYRLQGALAERVSFAIASTISTDWEAIDPSSTVNDWTAPGMQGAVSIGGRRWRVRNLDFGYRSFREAYERRRLRMAGIDGPVEYDSTLLECPWIDAAMQPGVEDPRFRFETPATITDAERAASPEQRLETCLRDPSVQCLLERALAVLLERQSLEGNAAREFADDALVADRPELAREAMQQALAGTFGLQFPNSRVAEHYAIKAEAEAAMGLAEDAKSSAAAAFANGMGDNTHAAGRAVQVLERIGPRLARAGYPEQALASFREVPMAYADDAPMTLEEMAVAQARSGDSDSARATLAELQRIAAPDETPDPEAIVAVAAGQAERGALAAAAVTLDALRLPPDLLPSRRRKLDAGVAAVRVRFPESRELSEDVERLLAGAELQDRLAAVAAACSAGNTRVGLDLLRRARASLRRPRAEDWADFGAAEATCGRADRAHEDFARARRIVARMAAEPAGRAITIPSPEEAARAHVRLRMAAAGMIGEFAGGDGEDPAEFALALAAKLGELGRAREALSMLDGVRIGGGGDDLQLQFGLTRARLLRLLARGSEAGAEYARAREHALRQDTAGMRVSQLVALANAAARDAQPELARSALFDARRALFADAGTANARSARGGMDVIGLARAFAFAGDDASAAELVGAGPRQLKFRAIAARASDRVGGEIALVRARTGDVAATTERLREIEAWPWRAWYVSRVHRVAREREDAALFRAAAGLAADLLADPRRTIEAANDAGERRRVYHALLSLVRAVVPSGASAEHELPLPVLRELLVLFDDPGMRARAGCELAFTLEQSRRTADAIALLDATDVGPPQRGDLRAPGMPPPPAGACSYWMADASINSNAAVEVRRIVEARRPLIQSRDRFRNPARQLQELAAILSESSDGEIDWTTGERFTW